MHIKDKNNKWNEVYEGFRTYMFNTPKLYYKKLKPIITYGMQNIKIGINVILVFVNLKDRAKASPSGSE